MINANNNPDKMKSKQKSIKNVKIVTPLNETSVFSNNLSLVGGNGTVYTSSQTNKTYARIDAVGTPGYFTSN